jgi:hypothetical protein
MAHEIGHTFGLSDAHTNTVTGLPCPPGMSVMGPLDPSTLRLQLAFSGGQGR